MYSSADPKSYAERSLQLGAGGDQSLAVLVALVLCEVLDEAASQILGLLFPLSGICVGVAGVEDSGVNAGQSSGDLEIEVGDLLGGSLVDGTAQDSVDDAAGILDGDALAGAVPAGVDQISLGAALLHLLDQLLSVLGGVQLQEGLTEAGGEGGGGLGDAALGAGQLCGEAGQEVVLGLLRSQDGDRGQDAECISRQEDDILGCGCRRDGADDVLDVVDGVGDAGVLGHALVGEIDVALSVQSDVLQQSVALDGVVDVGLRVLVQVDDLSVAAALEVEDAVVVPAVLVIADEQTLRVGGQGGLAGAGQTEEDGSVLALLVGVGRAVHGSDALQRQEVVHHGEHALLHLAAVPGVDDDLLLAGDVEQHSSLGVQAQLLVVLDLSLGSVVDNEIRLEVLPLLSGGLDEHIGDEMCLPGHFHDEADGHAGVLVGAAESIHDVQALVGELLLGDLLHSFPGFLRCGVVVVLVLVAGPPHGVLGVLVHDDELILGGAAGVDTGHDVDSAQLADLALLVAFQFGLGLLVEQLLVRGIVHDLGRAGDTILAQIQLCHDTYTSSFVQVIAQTPAVSCPQPKGHRKRTTKRNTDAYSPVYHYT